MSMKNPVHPGRIIRQECLEPLNLSVKDAAAVLQVSRQALNNVLNGKAALSAEMALRVEQAFGGVAATWLRIQANYDLAQAQKKDIHIERYQPVSD